LRECGELRESEVERIISAELGSSATEDEPQEPTWIVATCDNTRVLVEVGDTISRKTLRRSFDLGRAPAQARSRLVAIAASELVLASWAELAIRPRLRVEPEGPPPSAERAARARERATRVSPAPPVGPEPGLEPATVAEERDEPLLLAPRQRWLDELPPDRRRFRLTGMATVRAFLSQDATLWGAGARIGEERLVLTSWALDAMFERGTVSGFEVQSWSVGGMLYLYGRARFLTGRIGAGLRVGLSASTAAAGKSSPPPTRVLIPWGWPMLAAGVSIGRELVALELSAESGYVSFPVSSGANGLSVGGLWVGVQLGLSILP
jgi:hypothetical protein